MRWSRFKYNPCLPIGKDGKRVTGSKEHIELSRRAASEGMVLLKNENNVLPLKKGAKIALFGKASSDYVKGGGGSGDVTVEYVKNLCDGMIEKQEENKICVFRPLIDFYSKNVKEQYENGIIPGQTVEPIIPQELLRESKEFADVAVISICRFSGEGYDREEKDDFNLTESEQLMVETVSNLFEKTVLVLNVGGMVDSSYFINNDKIQSVLLAWQAGMMGGFAEADVLCGDACPCGKLTDTFASSFSDYPSSENFNESKDYVCYTDDIFVGYRYFETIPGAKAKVNYPFGFGLSYTSFNIEILSSDVSENKINIRISVKNVGSFKGKEVVQVYSSSPDGKLDKPYLELRAFAKTKLLLPNESQTLCMSFPIYEMSSYDEESASYILEQGEYKIFVGNCVRNLDLALTYVLTCNTVTETLSNLCVPQKLPKKLKSDGSYEDLTVGEYEAKIDTSDWPEKPRCKFEHIQPDLREIKVDENTPKLEEVIDSDEKLINMISHMSIPELVDLVGGCPNSGVANTWGIGDLPTYDIPAVMTADGPAGLRIKPEVGVCTTAWPCATLLACTWDVDLVEKVGKAAAREVKENNIGMWLTPALNIHRSPLCGRNFEYYSEDPVVSGYMAAAMVKGIQSERISACIKHFACNNKETNRFASDSIVSERALREIYLKGFQIVVKNANPWSLMTSYNIVNGTYSSENKDLITGILRGEWGYKGLVLSDWANFAEHYREILAGNNLRMPTGSSKRLLKALELGLITKQDLQNNVFYILKLFANL